MPATPAAFEDQDLEERPAVLRAVDAREEDNFWARAYRDERYFREGRDYEDYAPAYCVGYIGHAQYGGRFEDAERSLCANWERIKGDSRLPLAEALPAMRAAWDRMARRPQPLPQARGLAAAVGLIRRYLANPSFKPGMRLTR